MQCTLVDFHMRNEPEATEIDLHCLIGLPNVMTGLHKIGLKCKMILTCKKKAFYFQYNWLSLTELNMQYASC